MMQPSHTGRPKMQNYGITEDEAGLLDWSWAVERLTKARNYWIASTRPDSTPHAAPVWGLWLADGLYFGSGRTARKTRNLIERPQVVMHLESGDEVVIIEGQAVAVVTAALPTGFAAAYGEKYAFTPDLEGDPNGLYFRIIPQMAMGWLEVDFPKTATRWMF